jgi:transforming growth factor-beta-induced protein
MFSKAKKLVPMFLIVALLAIGVTAAFAAPARQDQTIVDIAVNDGRFTTLVTALQQAELVDTLNSEGPFTVFAPTDDAFAALPDGTLDSLLADIPALQSVLTYHVVPGKVMAADVVNLESADTVQGEPISISVQDGNVMVNNANVIITDIEASNGVIHVIDAVLLPPSMTAASEEDAMMEDTPDIVDIAVNDGRFSTLVTALQAAELVDTLKGEGPFTVFAPTDDAFAALPEGTLDGLLADIPALTNVLLYHVVPGQVRAADVVNLESADTVEGEAISITVQDGNVMVNNANVIITDIGGKNGVIHVIDAVILPPSMTAASEGEMMEEAMGESVASCTDYTVQADDWLSKIAEKELSDVLAYPQLVEATNAAAAQSSKYAMIENPDIIEIGQIICIPGDSMTSNSIVDIAVNDGRFTTLVTALQAADLVNTLSGEGPFTVFAPTDDAFAALPEGTLDSLLADIPSLQSVLTYHVVPGKVMAADVVNLAAADTVQGEPISITVDGDKVMVNNAQVIITDIEGDNGVIHVIDAVILPPSMTAAEEEAMMEETPDIVDIAVNDGRFTTLVTALQAAELVDTLKGEGPFTVFAPTDDAFAALPDGTLDSLLADIPALTNVLLYHVVPGKVMAADVVNLQSADTVLGQPVSISVEDDTVKVDEANVIITDIEGSNGVIHVIDAVLIPAS